MTGDVGIARIPASAARAKTRRSTGEFILGSLIIKTLNANDVIKERASLSDRARRVRGSTNRQKALAI
jgi:hypothetical protein